MTSSLKYQINCTEKGHRKGNGKKLFKAFATRKFPIPIKLRFNNGSIYLIIKDHVNIYSAIFKEPYGGSCHSDKKNWNYEFYKKTATVVKKERCAELMFGTSWEVGGKIIEVKWNSYVNM